jgi:phage FluMu protein Com
MKLEKLACPACGAPLSGDFASNQQIECDSCGVLLLLTQVETENPIFCPACRTLNANEVHFCAHCGHRLKEDCPLCHIANRIDAVFCARCGAHMERARARRQELAQARQRRQLEQTAAFEVKTARQQQEKLQALLNALDEPENHEFAIYQINQMGSTALDGLVDTLLNEHDPDARYGSARALGLICLEKNLKPLHKGKATKALIKALADPEAAVRFWAADALGKGQSHTAIAPLAKLLNDSHAGVREQAVISLQKIGGERVKEILMKPKNNRLLGWIKGN